MENTSINKETLEMLDQEIAEVLFAISVVTKQLSKKLTSKYIPKEENANDE